MKLVLLVVLLGASHAVAAPAPTRNTISAGMGYACVRNSAAQLQCWGGRYAATPATVAGVANVTGVVTNQAMMCAWTGKGEVYCQDGAHGTAPYRLEGIDDAIELASDPDAFLTCARRRTGHVACWSSLGKPTKATDVAGVDGALELAVGGSTACIRDKAGVACWSGGWVDAEPVAKLQRMPQAADAWRLAGGRHKFAALIPGKPAVGWHEDGKPWALPKLADATQVAIGGDDACALVPSGVQCWSATDPASIHDIPGLAAAQEITVGWSVACARVGAQVGCWGSIGYLGDGTPSSTDTPVAVAGLTDATRIAVSGERTCARRAGGQIVCWGKRADTSDPAPTPITGTALPGDTRCGPGAGCDPGVTRVWSGGWQRGRWTCKKSGTVACTMDYYGRRGENSSGPEEHWGNLDTARDIRMPSNMFDSVCVADASGSVGCFQSFTGAGDTGHVDGVADVVALAEYGEQTCAIEASGIVKCWNERERRYLKGKIATVPGITDAVEIAGGDVHACVRHRSGKVSCWGYRTLLGDDADRFQLTAKVVAGVTM